MTVNRANEVAREVGYALGRIDPVFHQPVVIQHIATAIQSEVDAAVRAETTKLSNQVARLRKVSDLLWQLADDDILDEAIMSLEDCRNSKATRLSKLEKESR